MRYLPSLLYFAAAACFLLFAFQLNYTFLYVAVVAMFIAFILTKLNNTNKKD